MNRVITSNGEAPKREKVLRKESPLQGWPKTTPFKDKVGFRIRARYLTPERAKFSEQLLAIPAYAALGGIIWAVSTDRLVGWPQILTAFGILVAFCYLLWSVRFILGRFFIGKVTKLEFLPDTIRIKNGWRFRNFERGLPHSFDVTVHDKAEDEQEQEFEAYYKTSQRTKRQNDKYEQARRKFYRKSFHIILRYAGQRIDVASVFGKKEAEAFVVRLQLVDELMSALGGDPTKSAFADTDQQYGIRPAAD